MTRCLAVMNFRFAREVLFALGCVGMVLALSDCALTSKAEFVTLRYFAPEIGAAQPAGVAPRTEGVAMDPASASLLRLGRVSSGSNLRERIAYRTAANESAYYEDLRWTERPEVFVRRKLGQSLFEVHGFRRAITGEAPTLEVEVIGFEELRLTVGRKVQIQLLVTLYRDNGVVFERTFTVDRPVAGVHPKIEDVVFAMATALDVAVDQVALTARRVLLENRDSAAASAL